MITGLAAHTWTELDGVAAERVLAFPLGSTEQHGPHLPLGTDTIIAVALAQRWAALRPDVVVAPPVWYGSSGEHRGFAGTVSVGQDCLESLVVELVRSSQEFAAVAFISAHGGNASPLGRAIGRLVGEGRRVRSWSPSVTGGDAHAGYTETSLLLALDPALVRLEHAEVGNRAPLGELLDEMSKDGVAAVSPNGVLGDPTSAHATAGEEMLARLVEDLTSAMAGWPQP